MSEKCCHEHIGGDTPAIAEKPCTCVSLEQTYVREDATHMTQNQSVTIRAHSGDCQRHDEIVRFGH